MKIKPRMAGIFGPKREREREREKEREREREREREFADLLIYLFSANLFLRFVDYIEDQGDLDNYSCWKKDRNRGMHD